MRADWVVLLSLLAATSGCLQASSPPAPDDAPTAQDVATVQHLVAGRVYYNQTAGAVDCPVDEHLFGETWGSKVYARGALQMNVTFTWQAVDPSLRVLRFHWLLYPEGGGTSVGPRPEEPEMTGASPLAWTLTADQLGRDGAFIVDDPVCQGEGSVPAVSQALHQVVDFPRLAAFPADG